MKTRCPNCKLIYNIRASTLKKADFKVVCSECHHVFSVKGAGSTTGRKAKNRQARETDLDIDLTPDAEMEDLLEELQQSLDKQDKERPEERLAPESEHEQPADAGEPETSSPEATEEKAPKPDQPTNETEHEPFIPDLSRQKDSVSWLGIVSLFFLLIGATLQLAWIERERLLQIPRLHAAAARLCPYVGCSLPLQKAAPSFSVVDRSLEAVPEQPGLYRLAILLRNDSRAAQPLPLLQLNLLDDNQTTIARRTFPANSYAAAAKGRMQAGEVLEINLNLIPSRNDVSGFELQFIPVES